MSVTEAAGREIDALLRSPLRVQLVQELLSATGPRGIEALAVVTGAPDADAEACLAPLIRAGWLVEPRPGAVVVGANRRGDLVDALGRIDPSVASAAARARSLRDGPLARIVGRSERMRMVLEQTRMAARTRVDVLVLGETGTGKELIARAIHTLGARAAGPFVAVNTAAIPVNLFEAEYFGHTRGAFTGASAARLGRFVAANGGTLFLDEIAELDLGAQAKLLRALQERSVLPLGAKEEVPTDFRLVAATHRPISDMAREGTFREDLLYRINVFTIWLPPLRERPEDIPELAAHLAATAASHNIPPTPGPSAAACERLACELWPGNVRQLENVVLRAALLAQGEPIEVSHVEAALAPPRDAAPAPRATADDSPAEPMDAIIRRRVLEALRSTGGNVTAAARNLAVSKVTLYRKLDTWEADRPGLLDGIRSSD
jgi:two-component system response regulator PilR (NtrC family)